jgi:NAD(P)-dependent dehydrogenase (short-subunit alcohol dehydrogenase family)
MSKVLIVGGNKGIGLALVEKFLKEGNDVIATCRKTNRELDSSGAIIIENVDVCDEKTLTAVKSKVGNVDTVICNAGIMIGDNLESLEYKDLLDQFNINSLGPLRVAKEFGPLINNGGKFGIMTSRMGSIADNTSGGQYGYRASKSAANAIGKSLSEDFRSKEITVLLLHPGYVKTDMTNGKGLIDKYESADGLFKIMNEKNLDETGTFWHTSGEKLTW